MVVLWLCYGCFVVLSFLSCGCGWAVVLVVAVVVVIFWLYFWLCGGCGCVVAVLCCGCVAVVLSLKKMKYTLSISNTYMKYTMLCILSVYLVCG